MGYALRRMWLPQGVASLLWNQWQLCRGMRGNFAMESVASFAWNWWQLSYGTGGNFRAEYAAEYHCRYDWQDQHVKDIRDGRFYATQFASPQGALIPLTAQESLVLYRPKSLTRQTRLPVPTPQLWLFELVSTA
jgi:hypothetical protein